MAPEQVKHSTINEHTDIYNFGATMYRLVTWRLPPPVATAEDGALPMDAKAWARIYTPVEEVMPKTPRPLCELINRCLSFDPHKRPERMSEVQSALDYLVDDLVKSPEDSLEAMEW
jgi:serine/threonine-protein kinase